MSKQQIDAAPEPEGKYARHRSEADSCVKNHVIAAMGIGLIPSVMVEVVGVTSIEVKMIRDLASIYEFPVPRKLVAYKILLSLIGSIAPIYLAARMKSAVKGLPLIGHAAYVGFLSVSNGAAVYAVGKVFQKHFESGGKFLSSDNATLRGFFEDQYAQAKELVPVLAAKARPAV